MQGPHQAWPKTAEGEDDPLAVKERMQGPNQAWLKIAVPVKVKTTSWLRRRGCRARSRRGRGRRPREGEDDPLAAKERMQGPEPGVAEDRRPREGEDDP